jgi:hypothetical protein
MRHVDAIRRQCHAGCLVTRSSRRFGILIRMALYSLLLTLDTWSEATLTSETPEGSVFELTAGKAPEGRPRGFGSPTQPPPWRGGFVPDIPHGT